MVAHRGESRFVEADDAVVRSGEPRHQAAQPERPGAGDDPDLEARIERHVDGLAPHPEALAQEKLSARALREVRSRAAARDRRADQHGAPDAIVGLALKVAQRDDSAEAVADQMHARRFERGDPLRHAREMLLERAAHGAVGERLRGKTLAPQCMSEVGHHAPVHPGAVKQQHRLFGRCVHGSPLIRGPAHRQRHRRERLHRQRHRDGAYDRCGARPFAAVQNRERGKNLAIDEFYTTGLPKKRRRPCHAAQEIDGVVCRDLL